MELYKKYRPTTLTAIVGNTATVAAVGKALAAKKLPHAVLLTGPSGTGKTTLARIIASELKVSVIDLQEMNSASFRGIDTVREIQQAMSLAPMSGPCRVWIMDEVHKLSNDAQNAFLKALEDTPAHVYFILCTTDPDKLIKAIRTRCTEYRFAPLTPDVIGPGLLLPICKAEKADVPRDVLKRIARDCNGSARAALVALEKVIHLEPEQMTAALDAVEAEEAEAIELCRLLMKRARWKEIADTLKRMPNAEPENIRRAVLGYMRAVLLSGNGDAYAIAVCFEKNYFDTGNVGLALSCFEACSRK